MTRVVVFDYGYGNVRSVTRALERAGAEVELTSDRDSALAADGLVVPGVGAFAACLEALKVAGGDEIIADRLADGRPVFGICVGLQVLFSHGTEHGTTPGLGYWPGSVDPLNAPVVPHMGWSPVEVPEGSVLFSGVADQRFYFVHSFAAQAALAGQAVLPDQDAQTGHTQVTWATHGDSRFIAAVEDGPLSGTQFHPEKSGSAGIALLGNWLSTLSQSPGATPPRSVPQSLSSPPSPSTLPGGDPQ
ncbi:MAG: imidazole glycerol phosphate synthase subunit HisH [Cellulomonadaceae bacterium]|jgi:glutamine amidotransferase|nr:imidazole glycerol phosphate synthase subunit HisH [Cellulomonadaceae bacterium]